MLAPLKFLLCFWSAVIIMCHIVIATVDIKCDSTIPAEKSVVSELLHIAGNIIESAKKYDKIKENLKENMIEKPMDCEDILSTNKSATSGVYRIWPRTRVSDRHINVYCDMEDDGGAWTVIQRRGDFDSGIEYFFRDWAAYKAGFGNMHKDFWLGNDYIFALTNQRANSAKFVLSDWDGNTTYATYDEFWIDDEDHKYTMHVKGYRGTAGDSFTGTNGAPFTTKDRDNDKNENNCAVIYKGAWWYTNCHASNLNGLYLRGTHESHADGVEWHSFKGHRYSMKDSFIKIRSKKHNTILQTDKMQ